MLIPKSVGRVAPRPPEQGNPLLFPAAKGLAALPPINVFHCRIYKLMEKSDWIQTVANIGVADRVWSENISTDNGVLAMPTLEAGTYQVIFVKLDAKTTSTSPVRKSARDFIGWGLQFDSTRCSTDEWMKELREGEDD